MRLVIEELKHRGEELSQMKALDMFGGDGLRETVYWGNDVGEIEIWEVMPQYEEGLKQLFPKAMVKIVDSYCEVTRTDAKYDLIVIDNPSNRCVGGHYEHFDLFPEVYRLCEDGTILILNVIPTMIYAKESWLERWRHFTARQMFYKTDTPRVLLDIQMVQTYVKKAAESGFTIKWSFFRQRSGSEVKWLALKLEKRF